MVVWGAHFHAVLAERAARLRLRRHGPTLQLYRVRDLPAGWGGANSLVRGGYYVVRVWSATGAVPNFRSWSLSSVPPGTPVALHHGRLRRSARHSAPTRALSQTSLPLITRSASLQEVWETASPQP